MRGRVSNNQAAQHSFGLELCRYFNHHLIDGEWKSRETKSNSCSSNTISFPRLLECITPVFPLGVAIAALTCSKPVGQYNNWSLGWFTVSSTQAFYSSWEVRPKTFPLKNAYFGLQYILFCTQVVPPASLQHSHSTILMKSCDEWATDLVAGEKCHFSVIIWHDFLHFPSAFGKQDYKSTWWTMSQSSIRRKQRI